MRKYRSLHVVKTTEEKIQYLNKRKEEGFLVNYESSQLIFEYQDMEDHQWVAVIENKQDCYRFAGAQLSYVSYGDGLWDAAIINYLSSRIRGVN